MKFHAPLARALKDNGIDTMFGLIGDANLYMVDSFVRECGGRYLGAANEAGAALMALGYASVSGRVGVATVTHGPALTNTLTALCEGVKGSISMVLVCGDTPIEERHHFRNLPQRELIVATGAGFEQLRTPATLAEDVATACRRAVVECRPIALNVAADFQWLDVDYRPARFRIADPRGVPPSSADLDDAIGIIAAAKRPVVMAGRGAIGPDAKQALLRLAARIDAPLATTLKANGLFRGEPFDLGVMGTVSTPITVQAILESDCLIAFGSSFNARTTSNGAFLEGKRVVQVNAEQSEVGRTISPKAGVVCDPALVADLIVHWLDEIEAAPSGYRGQDLERRLSTYSHLDGIPDTSHDDTVDLTRALLRLDDLVPADRILVTDAGRFFNKTVKTIRVLDPSLFVYIINSGSIGLGMAEAIGAASATPGRPTLLVTGDGGFMLGGLAEFNTAIRSATDLIVVICNDGSYGAEHVQFRNRQMDPSLTLFAWPDFASAATALGGTGVTIRTLADLDRAAAAIRMRNRPLLVDPHTWTINDQSVTPDKAPKSWTDALDPRWKGRVLCPDLRISIMLINWAALMIDAYGTDYLARLAAQGIRWLPGQIQGSQLLGAGEADLLLPNQKQVTASLIESGAPLRDVIPGPYAGHEGVVAIPAKAPHPASARLLADFIMSRPGAAVLNRDVSYSPLPDIPGTLPMPAAYKRLDAQSATQRQGEILELLKLR